MLFFVSLLLFSALASRALAAFNFTVNNMNITTSQLLNVPDNVVTTTCATNYTNVTSSFQACNDDPNCLCRADTVASLLDWQQCMFTKLIEINQKSDFRVGSQAVLSGYATACLNTLNVTLAASQTALTLPSNWDGPFDAVLSTFGVVVAIGSTVILGISALFILSNL